MSPVKGVRKWVTGEVISKVALVKAGHGTVTKATDDSDAASPGTDLSSSGGWSTNLSAILIEP